jgi:hypothetical protein
MAPTETSGLPLKSPVNKAEVLVPLLATQNGLVAVALMPHGLTSNGFIRNARPGESETRLVCRYALPGAGVGKAAGSIDVAFWATVGGALSKVSKTMPRTSVINNAPKRENL